MITIPGGELLCSLGTGAERINALRTGIPQISSMMVQVGPDLITYPYYFIDNTARTGDPAVIDDYLNRVVSALLKKLNLEASGLTNAGIFLGSSSIDHSLGRPLEQDSMTPLNRNSKRERVGGGNYIKRLMKRFGFNGPSLTFNTACTSSANALMDAAAMLETGIIDHALVLGVEISSAMTREGFAIMQLLSTEAVRPFARNRNGMVLGEAVSVVLLSRDDIMPSTWHYLGGKSCCETYSVTGSDPSGKGISLVISGALADAGISPEKITAIKAHGTGGELMDQAEMHGMEQVFGDLPPYFSLKPYIGHTLGGCGIAELLLVMACIDSGFIPATINCQIPDNSFLKTPLREIMPVTSGCFMLNYFGFGGNNTSFIIGRTVS
jgi:3-oxoacyl-[acyl-carrier-protein] synthase-1